MLMCVGMARDLSLSLMFLFMCTASDLHQGILNEMCCKVLVLHLFQRLSDSSMLAEGWPVLRQTDGMIHTAFFGGSDHGTGIACLVCCTCHCDVI